MKRHTSTLRPVRILSGRRTALCALVLVVAMGYAQVPSDLAQPKSFQARRASSADLQGLNRDSRSIQAGATLTLADIEGAGQINHIWFTINADRDHLREL